MNELTLNALLNLFAIFSVQGKSGKAEAQAVFYHYLKIHHGLSSPNEYTDLFDELIDLYDTQDKDDSFYDDLNNRAAQIAMNLKSRLRYSEQLIVLLRFLELARYGDLQKAENLIHILAEVFPVGSDEIEKFRQFIFYRDALELTSPDFLLLSAQPSSDFDNIHQIQLTPFDGEIVFFYLPPAGHYLFKFRGNENIFIEGNPILPNRFYAFREGSIIRGPRIAPIYYADILAGFLSEQLQPKFLLHATDIGFRYNNSSNGVMPFSFAESSGQLIAIMGGSGVGKSTLLHLLNGNLPAQQGNIYINNLNIHKNKKEIEGLIGFVPQDDLLFEDLTVWENMYFNACLCFDGLSEEQINDRVTNILKDLELLDCKDLKVGNPLKKTISGGQRKRLNIALELIREPALLYIDEPTSGLSSVDSEMVMLLLKEQARKGKIVVANIHQPTSSVFKLFDKLWVMDKGGRIIYTGNPLDAIIYFKTQVGHVNSGQCECLQCGNVNPEQVLEIIETRKIDESGQLTDERLFSPDSWYKLYKEKIESLQPDHTIDGTENPTSKFTKPWPLKQFLIFCKRNLSIKLSDRQYMLINIFEAPLLALIVAWFTRFSEGEQYFLFENKNMISYIFMSIVVVLFIGMSVSAQEIIKDRKILLRESFLNLSRFSYINSKILFLLLLSAFQTFVFVIIGNLVLEIQGMNFVFWMILFSVAVFSNMLGLNISSALDSAIAIYVLIPLLIIPQILLCGVIVKFDDLQSKTADKDAVPLAGELMVSRWAFEAMAVAQFSNNRYMQYFFEIDREISRSRFLSDILLTELTGRIDLVTGLINTGEPESKIAKNLAIVKNEIEKLSEKYQLEPFRASHELYLPYFTKALADSAKKYIESRKEELTIRNRYLNEERDRITNDARSEYGGDYLFKLKKHHHNKALEELLLNSSASEMIRITRRGIMQKIAPVYKKPDFNNGRAHFLSSEKYVAGVVISTPYFNVLVIWFMIAVLYLALYYDWVRKAITHVR